MRLPIEKILMQDFDSLKRDENGSIVYDKRLGEVADNLLNHQSMDSTGFSTYDEYFNAMLSESYQVNSETGLYQIPEGSKTEYRYVNDVLIKELWTKWEPSNRVYIAAGTGRGKNTFIKKELLQHCGGEKVVIFENRESLMRQQIMDLISEIDPEFLKYNDVTESSMVIFGKNKNIMLISYQTAALKSALYDQRFYLFCAEAKYLIFDEAHYILDDAHFNKGINFLINTFLAMNTFPNAIKIFMSGSMEEFYAFSQKLQPFVSMPHNIIEQKKLHDQRANEGAYQVTRSLPMYDKETYTFILSMPTDYSYITPYKYRKLSDIRAQVARSALAEKWLIFVKSIEEGFKLKAALQEVCGDSVCFLDASNKNDAENAEVYEQLVHKCCFDCRVLIATTVIYNGINIKDKAVKHIVIPFTTLSIMKQLIGRKRMDEGESVNVYFPDVTFNEVRKRYRKCIEDYMELINLNNSLAVCAMLQLNNLSPSKPSKYYYLTPQYVSNGNQAKMTLAPVINLPANAKLFFDTCFYAFVLHRMNPDLGDDRQDFISILLTHLDIAEKCSEVIDITEVTQDEKANSAKQDLADYLEKLIETPVVVPDENGSYDKLLDLKRVINDTHKSLHTGKNMDSQWKNPDRFYSEEKVKALLAELALPYCITSEGNKERRTITVTRQVK